MEIKADNVVDTFVEIAVDSQVFREWDELRGGDLGGRSRKCVSSGYLL